MIPFQLQIFLLLVAIGTALFLLLRKISFWWKCPTCGDHSPERIPRPAAVRYLLGFLPLQHYQCVVCRQRFYRFTNEPSTESDSEPAGLSIYQKLTFYLFPFLCLNSVAFLIVFIWQFTIGQYLYSVFAFLLVLSTDFLILVVNHAMMREELEKPVDLPQSMDKA